MSATDDRISEISLEHLHDSPFNPRRRFTGLEELAASIKAEGRVHEPLLVRPRLANVLRPDEHDGYEIVFGHRRARAAELAGLASVPCMVRAMSESEARSAQIAENLQRENVHALEEAESFQQLIASAGITADQLAERLGKSRSHVYGRLKLNALCPEVRKACLAGEVGSEVALLVARLRTDKLQAKALQYIRARNQSIDDGGKESYRRIRAILAERFNTALKSALFDTEDAQLLPDAGACTACPKRAGNAPEFVDIAESKDHSHWQRDMYGADVCTDPDCFDAKKRAHLKRKAAELQAKGKTVVDGNAARAALSADGQVKGAYIALKDVRAEMKKLGAKKTVATGDPTPQIVTIQDPRTGKAVEAVKRDDLIRAGAKVAAPPAARAANDRAANDRAANDRAANDRADQERREAQRQADQDKAALERCVRLAVLTEIRDAMVDTARDAFDLQLVAQAAWAGVEWRAREILAKLWGLQSVGALDKRLAQMNVTELTLFVMDCALAHDCLVESYSLDQKPVKLLAAAAHYGVPVDQVRAEVIAAASTPTPAARAPEKAAAGAKKAPKGPPAKPKGLTAQKQTDDAGCAGGSDAQMDAFAEEAGA